MNSWSKLVFAARLIMVATTLALLAACASHPLVNHDIPVLDAENIPVVQSVDLLEMTPEMKRFVDEHVDLRKGEHQKAWRLVYASLSPHALDFEYDAELTLGSAEAFRQKRGNCLTFSGMIIAMARYAGLNARFREVKVMPEWDNRNDTVLVSMHVNAIIYDRFDEYLVDVSRRERKFTEIARTLADREAEAQFYNNLGADALVDNDLPLAYAWFRKSIETKPGLAYVWSNLGVTLNRNGQAFEAEQAYLAALDYDPHHGTSLNNLIVLYEESGRLERATSLTAKVEQSRRSNPYYLKFQAEIANQEFRHEDAVDYSRRAVRLERRDYRLHYTLAESLYLNGDYSKALASLERARKLAPNAKEASRLNLPISD